MMKHPLALDVNTLESIRSNPCTAVPPHRLMRTVSLLVALLSSKVADQEDLIRIRISNLCQ